MIYPKFVANEPGTLTPTFPTLEPALHRHNQAAWIMTVAVLSTVHLPQSTFDRLEELDPQGHLGDIGGIGALMRIGEPEEVEGETTACPALDGLYAYLAKRGYKYIRLDPDGEVFADLPQFPWSDEY